MAQHQPPAVVLALEERRHAQAALNNTVAADMAGLHPLDAGQAAKIGCDDTRDFLEVERTGRAGKHRRDPPHLRFDHGKAALRWSKRIGQHRLRAA